METQRICRCGCGAELTGHPNVMFRHGHNRTKSPKYLIEPWTGCWIWQLGVDQKGYGFFAVNSRRHIAHRVFYERLKGPVEDGLHLDHLCRNRRCVNPNHLEAVSAAINTQRGLNAKVTPAIAREIRAKSELSTQKDLAIEFGLDRSTISLIVNRKRWRNIL